MAFSKKGKEEAAKAALSPAPEALSELEASQLYSEDPLEALLDEQSDEDFGDLELKERDGKPVKLAEWSAQDFSSIYLRFRPHLERHARRFLRNPSQVDEVVQDAFLYLMVSLPELDSEIGVLRFLKWKTRLLALDVIRASGRAYINSIDDVQEPESNEPEVSTNLEQQDDAAVVRLALSKLNPRHREVLIASMYEEKSTEEIASQVGLSENATRQLIFRARAAFKKALIGDVDTTGMSAAAILSVAARKAASEGKKVGAAALTLIALVVMSLTVFPGLNRATTDQMAEAPAPSESNLNSSAPAVVPTPKAGSVDGSDSEKSMANAQKLESVSLIPKPSSKTAEKALSELEPGGIFSSDSKTKAFVLDQRYTAVGENGLTVKFTFNPTEKIAIKEVSAEISLENMSFGFLPTDGGVFTGLTDELLEIYVYSGKSPYVYDSRGKKWTETASTNAGFVIQVVMEKNRVDVRSITLGMNATNE
jgi:RNA polymerase sigma-70 factor (ECF subfamily)